MSIATSAMRFLSKNAGTILTVAGTALSVATVIFTVKATKESSEKINVTETIDEVVETVKEAKETKAPVKTVIKSVISNEGVKNAAKIVAIPLAVGIASQGCFWAANILSVKQQASIMAAYAALDHGYRKYKASAKELFGIDGEKKIVENMKTVEVEEYKPQFDDGIHLAFYDELSDRYFEKTMDEFQDARYHLNRNFILRGYAPLNEFYAFLGEASTDMGNQVGWSIDSGEVFYGYRFIDIDCVLTELEDGLEVYRIEYPFPPTEDYMDPDAYAYLEDGQELDTPLQEETYVELEDI